MNSSLHLTLMMGANSLSPAPRSVLDALISAEVTELDEGVSGFSLTFQLDNRSVLPSLFLIAGGGLPPPVRIVLVVTVRGTPEVIADGMVTRTQVLPGSDAAHSRLQVIGEDLTSLMDKVELTGLPFPAMPGEAVAGVILAKYAVLGVIPKIIPSVLIDVPIPTNRIPAQNGSDLAQLRALASRVGYVFYVEPGPEPGTSTAYWGPKVKIGVPQPALNIDLDAHTNVEQLSFDFQPENRSLPVIFIRNDESGTTTEVTIPDVGPLNPPLGVVQPPPTRFNRLPETAKYSSVRAVLRGMAEASRSADTVSGNGSLDVARYGRLLRPRRLVGVRGAGTAFDGLHYVPRVTHSITRDSYRQSFGLARNGLISTVGRVPA